MLPAAPHRLDQGGDAHGDEGAGGAHQQDVTGADVPHPARLDDGRDAAHHERCERRPGEQRVAQPGGANHDGGRQHDAGDGEHGVLQAETEGERARWVFVRLVADFRGRGHRFESSWKGGNGNVGRKRTLILQL